MLALPSGAWVTPGAQRALFRSEGTHICESGPVPATPQAPACLGPHFTDEETEFSGVWSQETAQPPVAGPRLTLFSGLGPPPSDSQLLGEWQEP